MKSNEPDQSNQPPHRAIWKPPPWPILKVNSDDAIFREQNFVDVVLDMGGGYMCGGEKTREKRKRNVWAVWMQEKKGKRIKRIKNHNQMLPQYLYNISQ